MQGEDDRDVREADFWGHHLPSLDESLFEHGRGPDPNTAAMMDLLEPLDGATVLDFACGTGVTSAWLAARGAKVVGVDITPESISRARQLCEPWDAEVLAKACLRAIALTRRESTAERCRDSVRRFDWDEGLAPLAEQVYRGPT